MFSEGFCVCKEYKNGNMALSLCKITGAKRYDAAIVVHMYAAMPQTLKVDVVAVLKRHGGDGKAV